MPDHIYVLNQEPTAAELNAWVRDQVVTIETSANIAALSSPTTGRHCFDTDRKVLLRYSGAAWVPANIPVLTTATLPASPQTNLIVFDSDSLCLKRYTGAAWAAASTAAVTSGARPGTPVDGQMITETDTDRAYIYQGSAWCPVPGAHVAAAASAPNPADGVMHYTSDRRRLLVRNGSAWEAVGPYICTSSTRPTNPAEGDQIWETDTDRNMVYDGSNWVITPSVYVDTAVPTNKTTGALAHETTTGTTQVWNGSAWVTFSPVSDLMGNCSVTAGSTTYGGVGHTSATEIDVQIPISVACTVSLLRVKYNLTITTGSCLVVVRKAGADTAVTTGTVSSGTTGSDLTHSVAFAAGDLFSMKIQASGAPEPTRVGWSLKVAY